MLKDLKTKAVAKVEAAKKHVEDNNEAYLGLALGTLTAIAAVAGYKNLKRSRDSYEQEKLVTKNEEVDWNDKWLYQLDGQDQNWAMFVSDDKNHNAPDYKEIGRQIAEGEFREED